MISYVTIGSNDIARARRFYAAFLPALGYTPSEGPEGLSFAPADPSDGPDFYVKPPFNGQAASAGNGAMTAFEVPTQEGVRALHAAALSAGGTDEGAPGFRAAYSAGFYVAYLRDPDGNKIALYSDTASEPNRDEHPTERPRP